MLGILKSIWTSRDRKPLIVQAVTFFLGWFFGGSVVAWLMWCAVFTLPGCATIRVDSVGDPACAGLGAQDRETYDINHGARQWRAVWEWRFK